MSVAVSHGTDDEKLPSSKNTIHFDLMTIRAYLGAVVSQLQGRVSIDTVRPLNMFLGISGHNFCFSPEAFTSPVKKLDKSTPEKFKSRLKLNFAFFISNYALVAAGVSLVIALMHPGMLISLGVVWGLWGFHKFLISNEVIILGRNIGTFVSINHRSAVLKGTTILVVVFKCLVPTVMAVAISGLVIMTHALLRDPKHMDTGTSTDRRKENGSDDEATSSDSEVLVERPLVRSDLP